MIVREPNRRTNIMTAYMQTCISGPFSARISSAFVKSRQTSSAAAVNFSSSYSSLTNDFTTRMPFTFSWIELFSLSYFLKTFLKSGIVLRMTSTSPKARRGTAKRNIHAIRPPITKAITKANMSISGERMAMRMSIM